MPFWAPSFVIGKPPFLSPLAWCLALPLTFMRVQCGNVIRVVLDDHPAEAFAAPVKHRLYLVKCPLGGFRPADRPRPPRSRGSSRYRTRSCTGYEGRSRIHRRCRPVFPPG
jgi:hypothetical protein